MKEYLDLQDSSLLTLWSEKKNYLFGKCKGNRVLCVKTWVVYFVLMRAHNQIRFYGYPMNISDIIFLCSSAKIIVYHKKYLLWEIYLSRHMKSIDK